MGEKKTRKEFPLCGEDIIALHDVCSHCGGKVKNDTPNWQWYVATAIFAAVVVAILLTSLLGREI